MAHFPACQNVKKLTNQSYDYRLRVGRFRVFFTVDGVIRVVTIEEVRRRNENTC
nr:hypothetical protein [Endozoicomonas sp.]